MLASDVASLALQLPSYDSVSSAPPRYSSDPTCGEQSIQLTPRCRPRPSGTFVKKDGRVTVTLVDQEDGATMPVFGRQSLVNGIVSLDSREAVSEVKVKLTGHMDLSLSGTTSTKTKLVDYAYTVWKYDPDMATAVCPSELPFTCAFPLTYKDRMGRPAALPPSINVAYPGSTGLIATCVYTLTVKIVKARKGFWTQDKKLSIVLSYLPRNRAPSSLNPHPDLFSDVKISPEEWHQTMTVVKSRKPKTVSPVQAHLFVPSVKVFALTDAIHFHVQLTGALPSLRQLVYKHSKSKESELAPRIRVYLLRQISVEVCGQKAWKNIELGEGTLSPRPPPIISSSSATPGEDSLDWEGEIRCEEGLSLPGFTTGDLMVKDFIVLSISPAEPTKSDLLSTQVSVGIRLVTESAETWRED